MSGFESLDLQGFLLHFCNINQVVDVVEK